MGAELGSGSRCACLFSHSLTPHPPLLRLPHTPGVPDSNTRESSVLSSSSRSCYLKVFPVADLFLVGVGGEEEEEEMGEMEGGEGMRRNGLSVAGNQYLSGPSSAAPCSQPTSPAPDTYTVEAAGTTRTLPFWMRTPCH